ncbi:MAG: Crp/Fnr family transcriptional regulator [Deltaproteobacteria bacterium]|nr:Crp/Fnr family transcriptional regulator [Deltaproteobacteria bacterium]MBW1984050.1 Crp/Fnr family transcriptional regulator [Deltaproteobacteria bacterium]
MEKILNIISNTPLFSSLTEDQVQDLSQISIQKRFKKGETIYFEGDEGNGFYIVIDGNVKIFKLSIEGKEHILHFFGPGEPIGEVPVFSGQRFPANAEAVESTHLLFFPRTSFIDLISKNPSLSINMLAVLSKRLKEFTVQIENLSLKEVPARLASYLILLSKEQGTGKIIKLSTSKGQLASLLGTIPETLSRIFSKMAGLGYIKVDGRDITLLDPDGLEDLSQHGKLLD